MWFWVWDMNKIQVHFYNFLFLLLPTMGGPGHLLWSSRYEVTQMRQTSYKQMPCDDRVIKKIKVWTHKKKEVKTYSIFSFVGMTPIHRQVYFILFFYWCVFLVKYESGKVWVEKRSRKRLIHSFPGLLLLIDQESCLVTALIDITCCCAWMTTMSTSGSYEWLFHPAF